MPWATSLPVLLVMTFMSTLGCGMIDSNDVHIHIPFAILGVYALVVAILFLYLFCFHRKTEAHASRIAKAVTMMLEAKKESVWKKRIVVMVAAMFMFTALGFEVGMGSFITSFAVMSDLHLTKQVGAYMTSLYWAMFTSFKLIAVGVSDKIGPYCSIIIDLIVLIVANAFLLPFGNSVQWCLWIGVSLVGVGTSSIWAALFGFLDNYVPVTSKIASFLIVSACVGEWVFPTIMGYAVETHPQIFLWVLTLCTLLCCILFFILNLLCRNFISLAASRKASADKVTRVPGNRHISVCSHVDFK
ncbi:hypothetical protein HDE_01826 [Halotydeus destructor]|nr:hypothetical protein HDE_01826 [Halotydeus destructor]